ncbi:MAG: O-methyltransferase [Muribaculaceae bacterium]|nr:O-methyltransferase [Muribaculaceae bacterium]
MEITEEIYEYIDRHIDAEPEELHKLMRESNLRMVHGRMCSGHLQGRLLKMLVSLTGARRILELGTFTGYSTLCLAEGVAGNLDGEGGKVDKSADAGSAAPRVDTIEIFDENEIFLREVFARSEYGDLVNLIIGDALEVMPGLKPEDYDMIFIDADKRVYADYYREAKRLLRPGGCIVADNTLWDGHVIDSKRHDRQTEGVRKFNETVAADPETESVILPLRDGLTIIRKR